RWDHPADKPEDGIALRMHLDPGMTGDPERGDHQEGAEDVEDPLEAFDQSDAREDEHGPQDQGAEDSPEEHTELVLGGDTEEREEQRPDEHVVDRQALLDQVAGDVLARRLPSVPPEHQQGEAEPEGDPHGALDGRLTEADD